MYRAAHKSRALFLAYLAAALLGACASGTNELPAAHPPSAAAPTVSGDVLEAVHAQRLAPANSMLGEACLGHHRTHGRQASGASAVLLEVAVSALVDGALSPIASGRAPTTGGIARIPLASFHSAERQTGGAKPLSCSGIALKTTITTDGEAFWVEYDLELALPGDGTLPVDPYRIQSGFKLADGAGTDRVAFEIGTRQFVAHLKAAPGPAWTSDERAGQADAPWGAQGWAKPLPDELVGRTLEDAARASSRSSSRR